MMASFNGNPADDVHVVDATMFWSTTGGGVRRYLEAKHAWMGRHAGWRHTIAAPAADADGMVSLPSVPLPGSGGYRMPLRRRAVAATLAKLAPDVIEAGDPYRVAWGALDAAKRLQIPAVAYCHSNVELLAAALAGPRFASGAARAARRYASHLYQHFDLVLAPSDAMRRRLVDWGASPVVRVPLGVDSQAFHPGRASMMWRNQLCLPAGARLLVYAGRFAREKHLDVLADAVRRLGPPYILLAVGAGPTPPRGDGVMLSPHRLDPFALATVLASADVFIHGGDQETFGLSVLEAMSCGLPVIARPVEGLADLVDDSVGQCVHGPRADDFARAVFDFFERDHLALSLAARRRAEAYDWNRVLPLLMAQYRRLLRHEPTNVLSMPGALDTPLGMR